MLRLHAGLEGRVDTHTHTQTYRTKVRLCVYVYVCIRMHTEHKVPL